MRIEEQTLRRLWPRGDGKIPGLIEAIARTSDAVFARRSITTPLRAAHLMAQLSHECGAGLEVEENLSYTAKRICDVWPSRFPTLSSALPYQRNPRKLADKVYNGRMGNRPGTDDGYDFRGRGGAQTTGREAYERLGRASGHDLIADPDLLNDPDLFLDFAAADFVMCGCLPFCDPRPGLPLGDITAVTHHLNGGLIGLNQRKVWFQIWCKAFGVQAPAAAKPATAPVGLLSNADGVPDAGDEAGHSDDGVLRYGQENSPTDVMALQDLLRSKGYFVGKRDGDFSTGLRSAVLSAQADNGLETTGKVTASDKAVFETMPDKPIGEFRSQATADDLRASGSRTIAAADKLSWLGKIGAALGIGGAGADQSGVLDRAKDAVDQASGFRDIADGAGELLQWAGAHWYILAALAGVAAWYLASRIIAQRVQDHRSGANMAR